MDLFAAKNDSLRPPVKCVTRTTGMHPVPPQPKVHHTIDSSKGRGLMALARCSVWCDATLPVTLFPSSVLRAMEL